MIRIASRPGRPAVPVAIARRVFALHNEVSSLSLDVLGHDELWGCLRAASATIEQVERIVQRDLDRGRDGRPRERKQRQPVMRRRRARKAPK